MVIFRFLLKEYVDVLRVTQALGNLKLKNVAFRPLQSLCYTWIQLCRPVLLLTFRPLPDNSRSAFGCRFGI